MIHVREHYYNYHKKYAMTIGSKSWGEIIQSKTTNIASGFRVSGLCTFSFLAIQLRVKLFKDGGIALSEDNKTCMRFCETV